MFRPAMRFCPLGFTTRAEMEMAFFRADNATVALRQRLEAGKTITLVKTRFRLALAMRATDHTGKTQAE